MCACRERETRGVINKKRRGTRAKRGRTKKDAEDQTDCGEEVWWWVGMKKSRKREKEREEM